MVLAQKQIRRPVEQNRDLGHESTQLHLSNFWQRCQKHMIEKRLPLPQTLLGNWISASKKLKLNPCLLPCTSIN
jgi:hypothetical protein